MENWITRGAAAMCAAGGVALFWTFGMFVAVPWREGRMLALNAVEIQVVVIPLLVGLAVAWGALHIFAMSDGTTHPKVFATLRVALLIMLVAALFGGMSWSEARITP